MSVHYSLTGVSTCGKSVVLKEVIIPGHRAAGRDVIVLDPLGAQWRSATRVTTDPFQFVDCLKRSWNCVGIVDEIRVFYDDFQARVGIEWCFFAGRNRGHLMYCAAQRMKMIPPNIREQCGNALLFNQTARGLIDIAEDLNQPDAVLAAQLPRGQCLIVKPMALPVWYEVFDVNAPTFRLTRRTLGVARGGQLIRGVGQVAPRVEKSRLLTVPPDRRGQRLGVDGRGQHPATQPEHSPCGRIASSPSSSSSSACSPRAT